MAQTKCYNHHMVIRVNLTGGCSCDGSQYCYCDAADVSIHRYCYQCGKIEVIPGLTDSAAIGRWFTKYFADKA